MPAKVVGHSISAGRPAAKSLAAARHTELVSAVASKLAVVMVETAHTSRTRCTEPVIEIETMK